MSRKTKHPTFTVAAKALPGRNTKSRRPAPQPVLAWLDTLEARSPWPRQAVGTLTGGTITVEW